MGKLYLPTELGSLAVPNLEHYYLAAQLQWIARWMSSRYLSDTASLQPPLTLSSLLQIFHPCSRLRPPHVFLITVAYKCFRRSLFLTRATIPYAPALPLLGTPRRHLYH